MRHSSLMLALALAACSESAPTAPESENFSATFATAVAGSQVAIRVTGSALPRVERIRFVSTSAGGETLEGVWRPGPDGSLLVTAAIPVRAAPGTWDLVLTVTQDPGPPRDYRLERVLEVRAGGGPSSDSSTLRVRVTTEGVDPDPAFLVVREDGCDGRPCAPDLLPHATSLEYRLPAGTYHIQLADVAPHCTVSGPNPATAEVRAELTTDVAFRVTCGLLPTAASLRVRAWVTGILRDTSFIVRCHEAACLPRPLSAGTSGVVLRVAPGSYQLVLEGVSGLCRVANAPARDVVAVAGDTVDVDFAVSCDGPRHVEVTVALSGESLDPTFGIVWGGLGCPLVEADPCTQPAERRSDLRFRFRTPASGEYVLRPLELSSNCRSATDTPLRIAIPWEAPDTVRATLEVRCQRAAEIRVTVQTSGHEVFPAYQVSVRGECGLAQCEALRLEGRNVGVLPVAGGTHTVMLDWYPAYNCVLTGPRSIDVEVPPGGVVEVTFDLRCMPSAVAQLKVVVTGTNPDGAFTFVDYTRCDDYYYGCAAWPIGAGESTTISLADGHASIELRDVAANCRVLSANPFQGYAPAGGSLDVTFTVECR